MTMTNSVCQLVNAENDDIDIEIHNDDVLISNAIRELSGNADNDDENDMLVYL